MRTAEWTAPAIEPKSRARGYLVFRKYATKKCSSAWIFTGTQDVLVSLKST